MVDIIRLTLNLGGRSISHIQQIYGRITEENGEYLMFADLEEEDQPPRKVLKKLITAIDRVEYVEPAITAVVQGG